MKPLLNALESWLRGKMKTLSRHSELAKAFTYALKQWPALTYYAADGWVEARRERGVLVCALAARPPCSTTMSNRSLC